MLHSQGQPLDARTRSFFEPRLGHNFSAVRVHTDAKAAESARAVNALAYTIGRDVFFGAGQYRPESAPGRELLAHELTHVVQQNAIRNSLIQPGLGVGSAEDALGQLTKERRGKSDPFLRVGRAGDSDEHEADIIAQNIVSTSVGMRGELRIGSSAQIQCKTHKNVADTDLPADEAADGMTLTEEEAELLEEALSATGDETVALDTGASVQLQHGIAAEKNDPDEKPGKKRVAKRRRRIRKGHFVGSWLIRLLCGHSGRYFRHRDLLSCLKSKRKHRPQRQAEGRATPPEREVPPPPEREVPPPPEREVPPPPEREVPPPPEHADLEKLSDVPKEVPPPIFRGRRIPPGSSITETFAVSFKQSSDSYNDESAVAAMLSSLANLLKRNPGLRITITGNVYNDDPGIIKGGSKAALSQKEFYLNGKPTTAGEIMLARARSVRKTLTRLKVANVINIRAGKIMGPEGLKISIRIINPAQ